MRTTAFESRRHCIMTSFVQVVFANHRHDSFQHACYDGAAATRPRTDLISQSTSRRGEGSGTGWARHRKQPQRRFQISRSIRFTIVRSSQQNFSKTEVEKATFISKGYGALNHKCKECSQIYWSTSETKMPCNSSFQIDLSWPRRSDS